LFNGDAGAYGAAQTTCSWWTWKATPWEWSRVQVFGRSAPASTAP
jgi:hypothetical protein